MASPSGRAGFVKPRAGGQLNDLQDVRIRRCVNVSLPVALNVNQGNHAARRVYERIGFARYCAFIEGRALRDRDVE